MLGAAKRLIVWSPWPPCLTQSVWSNWSIIRRIFVVHFSIVILVFHDFDGMGCLKFPVWYFHAHYLSEDWRVSISMQISELVALSTAAFLHTDHPPFTNLQLNSSTLQFSIWGSCNLLFADLQKAQDITCAVAVTLNSKTSLNQLADVNIFKNIYFQWNMVAM